MDLSLWIFYFGVERLKQTGLAEVAPRSGVDRIDIALQENGISRWNPALASQMAACDLLL